MRLSLTTAIQKIIYNHIVDTSEILDLVTDFHILKLAPGTKSDQLLVVVGNIFLIERHS